ncbi:TPA: arsenical pump-driving ATPase [Aeromonas hydrophila]|uniref:arsenical pump-driving ATPase n=1 Tax=Aeromonas TaxID=642 RepID=UPI00090A3002|nr:MULTISPECIES: arsenical pump-driving ATPase [Aeromonas]HEB4994684.1 arsenical pump-driving ATPase [Aeromonas hydrophila subsp. hydrophila]APJ14957.1 arsenical pump-driving ATPase [Aeromonas hydrophila]BBT07125.1 arsenical pump-driving ATPase [Aeromonas hydrophila]HEB5044815.1 arsenical pump-driving ATPase [Aeromonas hydrophila subsp. hydrophila]HEB5077618.1 arsenical pump-driving ATPase [Aeromonas hydrophila subsp. hydrophila]
MSPLLNYSFLNDAPPFLFFTGKGGVGKTSLACASAVALCDRGKRVLLVSTDPASNVGQVFDTQIGNSITAIAAVSGLSALEIDPQAAAQAYRERVVGPVRGKLPESVVRSIEEQLSGACTTEIAAFDEFTALLTDSSLVGEYDHIVFDTAPTGHTIRLLQLPGAWSEFLAQGKGDASCLGPLAGLEKQRSQYAEAVAALANAGKTRLILVARAQASTLREVARTHDELATIGLANQQLVINGIFPQSELADDPLATAVWQREQQAMADMPALLASLPQDSVPLLATNLVGVDSLRQLLGACPVSGVNEIACTAAESYNQQHPGLKQLVDELATDSHGLIMLMGKGGVGKTTLAAAVAVELASRGLPVHLTTSDPAAHLGETLAGALPSLEVSRIDPHAETERYRAQALATKGASLDAQGRALLEEDLRSPCTEEIAVFQAFSRIIREAGKRFVVMDTAPTGHTLLLLDATGAYHREIARQMGGKGLHFTTPMMQLQDPKQTKVMIVTLPEPTPVQEATNLQADLRRAGIEPWAWVVNHMLAPTSVTSPLLAQRAYRQQLHIDAVKEEHAKRYAVVPLQAVEPVGVKALQDLCHPIPKSG